jgi:hypothetical protein
MTTGSSETTADLEVKEVRKDEANKLLSSGEWRVVTAYLYKGTYVDERHTRFVLARVNKGKVSKR